MPAPWTPNAQRLLSSWSPVVPESWRSGILPDEDSAAFSKGLLASTIGAGESEGLAMSSFSKQPKPQETSSLEERTGQPSSQREGIMTRFLAGLAPGDPGHEQLQPERLSQTHLLQRKGSFDWDQSTGGAPTTPPSVVPTLRISTSPPPLPLPPAALVAATIPACSVQPCITSTDASLATQFYGDEHLAASHMGAAGPLTQGGESIALCARPCNDVLCSQLSEDMPGTQFYEAMPAAQLCEHLSGTQLHEGLPLTQSSAAVCKDLQGTELCKDLPDTQLRKDLPDTQHYGDVMPARTLDTLPGQQVSEDQLRTHDFEDVLCTQIHEDLPRTQVCENLPGPLVSEELPSTHHSNLLPGSQPCEDHPSAQPSEDTLVCAHASVAVKILASHTETIVTEEHTIGRSKEGVVAPSREMETTTVTPVRPIRCPKGNAGSASKGRTAIATSSVEQLPAASAIGHTLQPPQQSLRIAVVGDGWGCDEGGHEAVVTEADHYTFTVIATNGKHPWTESHVLKENCIFLSEEASPAHINKRQRRSSGKRKS